MARLPHARAIQNFIAIPAHIEAAASAVRYDLMHGPTWARIPAGDVTKFTTDDFAPFREDVENDAEDGDVVVETYTSAIADALRAFIDDLPSELWVDTDFDCVLEREPEAYETVLGEDDDGNPIEETFETDMSCIWHFDRRAIVTALFGDFVASQFA